MKDCHSGIYKLLILIRKYLCLRIDKLPYQSALQYGIKWKKKKIKISKEKDQAHSQKEVWKSWYQLEKEPYFPYGKRAQREKISKLF